MAVTVALLAQLTSANRHSPQPDTDKFKARPLCQLPGGQWAGDMALRRAAQQMRAQIPVWMSQAPQPQRGVPHSLAMRDWRP